jgi:hypothetical protein
VELKLLPGAPVPEWQAMSDRGDKFREFREKHLGTISTSLSADSNKISANGRLLDQYRIKTVATSFNGVVRELCPADLLTGDIPSIVNLYAGWMLRILLALRQQPGWMYQAIGTIGGEAMKLAEKARYDKWAATIASRRKCDLLSA